MRVLQLGAEGFKNRRIKIMSRKISRKDRLDIAWEIAFNSMTYHVVGNGIESADFMKEANFRLQNIDRNEWFPEAHNILENRLGISYEDLAVKAAEAFLNKHFKTTHLRVYLGGDT